MSVPVEQRLLAELPAFPERSDEARQAAERERLALAQQLHDSLCQSLNGIRLLTTLAERKARKHPELAADLTELRGMVGTVCDDVHKLVEQLRTPAPKRSQSIK